MIKFCLDKFLPWSSLYGFPASFLKRAVHRVVNSLILIEPSLEISVLKGDYASKKVSDKDVQLKFKTNQKIIFLLILVKSPEARFHCSETSEVIQ